MIFSQSARFFKIVHLSAGLAIFDKDVLQILHKIENYLCLGILSVKDIGKGQRKKKLTDICQESSLFNSLKDVLKRFPILNSRRTERQKKFENQEANLHSVKCITQKQQSFVMRMSNKLSL